MVEGAGEAGLLLEAVEAVAVVAQLGGQDLDSDGAVEAGVFGSVDLPHPPGPEGIGTVGWTLPPSSLERVLLELRPRARCTRASARLIEWTGVTALTRHVRCVGRILTCGQGSGRSQPRYAKRARRSRPRRVRIIGPTVMRHGDGSSSAVRRCVLADGSRHQGSPVLWPVPPTGCGALGGSSRHGSARCTPER